MSGVTIRIEGLAALEHRLANMGERLDDALADAGLKSAMLAQGRAMERTPVRTGNLRRSETTGQTRADGKIISTVGTNVIYGIYVHEGTRYMHARPFFTQALTESEGDIITLHQQALEELLN